MTKPLTQSELLQLVHYNPETGEFSRRNGAPASVWTNNWGARLMSIGGEARVLHNMAFLYAEGRQPAPRSRPIKHINGDQGDLRFSNLVWVEKADGALTADDLRTQLLYDPNTGSFMWLKPSSVRVSIGDSAGSVRNGYLQISVNGRRYQAHRLAWLYAYGEWPDGLIDHRDRNPLNNRLDNLREASKAQNGQNSKDRGRVSGYRGVVKCSPNRWSASIKLSGKRIYLGSFKSAEEASSAYEKARDKHYTHHRG